MTHATNADILNAVELVRTDLEKQGADLAKLAAEQKRLADAHNEHERRLKEVELIRGEYRGLVECNNAILQRLEVLRVGQEDMMAELSKRAASEVRTDILATRTELRLEMLKNRGETEQLKAAVEELTKLLKDRPCVVGDSCPEGENDA